MRISTLFGMSLAEERQVGQHGCGQYSNILDTLFCGERACVEVRG